MNINTLKTIALPTLFNAGITPVLVGHRGVGKTEAVRQYAEENGYFLKEYRLGQATDGGDLTGLGDIIRDANGNAIATKFALPEFLHEIQNKEKVILFFDEFNRASKDMLQYIFELIYEGTMSVNGFKMPKEGHVVLAMNPATDEYDVLNFQEAAFYDRLCQIKIETEVSDWIPYAKKAGVDSDITDFVASYPQIADQGLSSFSISAKWSFRSQTRFDKVYKQLKKNQAVLGEIGIGMIGLEATNAFLSFLKERKTITIQDVLADYSKVKESIIKFKSLDVDTNRQDILANLMDQLLTTMAERETVKTKFTSQEVAFLVEFLGDIPADLVMSFVAEMGKYPEMITPHENVEIQANEDHADYLSTNSDFGDLLLRINGIDPSKKREIIQSIVA